MFLVYGKSDKQYYVLPQGGYELRLVTNPKFRKKEKGYLDLPGQQFGHSPAPELPKPPTTDGRLSTSGMPMSGELNGHSRGLAQSIAQPVMNLNECQPIMPTPAPVEAPTAEKERGTKPSDPTPQSANEGVIMNKERADPAPKCVDNNENEGAEPTPEQLADNPHGGK